MCTFNHSMVWFALLAIGFACTGSISAPVQAQDVSPETQLKVRVTGSWGGAVESATVTQRYRATQGSRTQTSGSIPYVHVGQGRYEATANPVKYSAGRYSYALKVSAPDYASKVVSPHSPALIRDREVELVHNNYYARCNRDWEESWIEGLDSPWEDCKVDPERLIETFGTKTKRFQTKPVPEDVDPRTPIEQLPSIWSSFEVHRPLPALDASEEIHLQTREAVYEKLIEAVALAPARAKALAQSRTLYRRIEERLTTDEQVEWERLAEGEAAVSDILGEAVSTGSESVEALGSLGEAVSLGLKLGEAWETGRLDGLLRIVVYQSSSGRSVDWALKRIERLAAGSPLQNDPAFASALKNVREKIERQQSLSPEELVQRYRSDRIGEVAAEIFISMGAEAAVKTLATKALAATGAKASLAAAGAGGLAAAGPSAWHG